MSPTQAESRTLRHVHPALALRMLEALRRNDFDEAMRAWDAALRFEKPRLPSGRADNVSVVKEALVQLGLCRANVRPPSRPLPGPIKEEISGILQSWGLA
jgi:4-hydroxy-tetrahydrodipicolinate synthase